MDSYQDWQPELQEALALLGQNRPGDCAARLRALLRRCGDNDALCRALTLDGLSQALLAGGKGAEAVAALEESLALLREAEGPSSPLTLGVMQHLAHLWLELDQPQKSRALGHEAVQRCEEIFGQASPRLAQALFHHSAAFYRQRDWDAAEACLRRALSIWEALRPLPPQVGTCFNNLGRIYEERGQMAEGIALHRRAVAVRRELLGLCHEDTAFSLGNLGVALASDGQWQEAADTLEAAVSCYARLGRYDSPEARSYKQNLAVCRQALAAEGSAPAADGYEGREALLSEIIERELTMFLATPNEGGVSACQQRPDGFRLMRRMAHEALGLATLASYLEDLRGAEREGRNFMIEKYARMDNRLPPLQTNPRIDEILRAETAFMGEAAGLYPRLIGVHGEEAFRNYLRSELETLSPATLNLYAADLLRARQEKRNPVVERYRCLARLLGKTNLDELARETDRQA